MKILSLNSRDTNSKRKRKRIKDLERETKTDFLCLQESKKKVVTKDLCDTMWIDKDFGWSYSGSSGSVGGLIIIWKKPLFKLEQQWITLGALAVRGRWGEDEDLIINVANVYAPCDTNEQQALWNEIKNWVRDRQEELWCICGDFNSVVHQSKIKGLGKWFNNNKSRNFAQFIAETELCDLPLLKRKFTLYKDNGSSCSRLDRFLLSTGWCNRWKDVKQISLKRSISDHAPILLENVQNMKRGPIPFRFVNWWIEHPKFRKLVTKVWKGAEVEGWGGHICKEKLKKLKGEIKRWKLENGAGFSKEIVEIEKSLSRLDAKLETSVWSEEDRDSRRDLLIKLEEYHLKRDRLLLQKSRSRWLKDGDENSSFFHSLINKRNRLGEISCVKVKEKWLEGGREISEGIFHYFKEFFSELKNKEFRVRGINYSKLDKKDNDFLIKEFSEEEVKRVIWSCDDNKSPGPDGFNFKFIKSFWDVIEKDVVRFCKEFHQNGKLA
ncbi:hypothetical protein ACS0TY_024678 [Phlomoides rotata]